jgi:hypothetical protein
MSDHIEDSISGTIEKVGLLIRDSVLRGIRLKDNEGDTSESNLKTHKERILKNDNFETI